MEKEVYAQDWYEYDQDGFNRLPESFTSYHITKASLERYIINLEKHNEKFEVFERVGESYITHVSEDTPTYD